MALPDPQSIDKYVYINKSPAWLIRGFYGLGIIAWSLVAFSFLSASGVDPFFSWFVTPIVLFFTFYHFCTYGLNLFYRQFNLSKHHDLVKEFWSNHGEPFVDIFLPICGEDIEILQNTWKHIASLPYRNKRVYVLDDSRSNCDEHRKMAEQYNFTYLSRPNKGWMKKAGNLRYAYERSRGEFIIIFDADFAPHPDFIKEALPHMQNPRVGIVQSPQYFDLSDETRKKSPLAYGAAHVQEAFYRFIQVARDRFGGTICCGSNAIYRRAALDEVGGTALIEHSEDAHTGFSLVNRGWIVRYIPVILAVGVCPDDAQAYFHQQHRWCFGSLSLLSSRKFWNSPISWKTKYCYGVGFLYYLHHLPSIFFSFQLFWTLFFYNQYIALVHGIPYYPYMIWGFTYMLFFSVSRFRRGVFYASFLQLYSYSHAIVSALFSGAIGWIPTNTKTGGISNAFRQATLAVGVYILAYVALISFASHEGLLHIFNYDYFSVQFWIVYNLILTVAILWQMYSSMTEAQKRSMVAESPSAPKSLTLWHFKTAGPYIGALTGIVVAIFALLPSDFINKTNASDLKRISVGVVVNEKPVGDYERGLGVDFDYALLSQDVKGIDYSKVTPYLDEDKDVVLSLEFKDDHANLRAIAAGAYDSQLTKLAEDIATDGRTIWLRPLSEFNGNWHNWGVFYRGNFKADFVPAWRHIVTLFREANAPVKFQLAYNNRNGAGNMTPFSDLWVGDEWVDMVVISNHTVPGRQGVQSFSDAFEPAYQQFIDLTEKPIGVAEIDSSSYKGDRPSWIYEALYDIAYRYPRVEQVTWEGEEDVFASSEQDSFVRGYALLKDVLR